MAIEPSDTRGAIIVALDPAAPGIAGLDLLRDFATEQQLELLGLFIEDADLLAHAHSRLATEIVLSGVARPLDLTNLERQLRAQSLAIRRTFEAEAVRLGLPHGFRTLRGTLVSALTVAAENADMLVIELARRASGTQSVWEGRIEQLCLAQLPTVLYAREGGTAGRTVLAIIDAPEDLEMTGRVAASLARAGNISLTALIGERASAQQAEIETRLRRLAGSAIIRLERLEPAEPSARALAHLAQVTNARALVTPAKLTRTDSGLVRELLRLTECSIMVVSSGRSSS